jgi:replicative DNA helicase
MGLMENLAMAEGHYREYYQDAREWPSCLIPRQKRTCCVYVMLESSKVALANRLICGRSQVGVQRIRDGMLKSNDFQLIGRCAAQLAESPIFVLDESDLTVEMLEMKLKAFKQQHPELGAVFVDHCGLLSAKAIKEGEATAKATYVSGRLRKLWKSIDVIGFPMWQLSREVEKTASKRPNKSHLRDSGNIENDATHILMLYRPSYYFPDSDDYQDSDGYAIVAKNREGPVNLEGVPLEWMPSVARYKSKNNRLYSNNESEHQEIV